MYTIAVLKILAARYPGFCPSRLVKLGVTITLSDLLDHEGGHLWIGLVLLRVGFAVPRSLPYARCALTAPFHPYPCGRFIFCGTFHPTRCVSPSFQMAHCPMESGSSSPCAEIGRERLPRLPLVL